MLPIGGPLLVFGHRGQFTCHNCLIGRRLGISAGCPWRCQCSSSACHPGMPGVHGPRLNSTVAWGPTATRWRCACLPATVTFRAIPWQRERYAVPRYADRDQVVDRDDGTARPRSLLRRLLTRDPIVECQTLARPGGEFPAHVCAGREPPIGPYIALAEGAVPSTPDCPRHPAFRRDRGMLAMPLVSMGKAVLGRNCVALQLGTMNSLDHCYFKR